MICRLDKNFLYSYADGTIEPLEKIIVEEHLKYCSECNHELEEIKNMDRELETLKYDDIDIPDRLSLLSELIVENCMNEKEQSDSNVQYNNFKEGMKLIKDTAIKGYMARYENPYDKKIESKLKDCTDFMKGAAKKYCRNKVSKTKFGKSRLLKMLKVV